MEGFDVSNQEIEHFFENNDKNLFTNFVRVFPADKKGVVIHRYWWRRYLFFDLFGSYGFLNSIVTNDVDVFNKVIPGQSKQIFKKYNKISLLKWNFRLKNYEKLIQKQLDKFSPTARHFFKFIYDFGRHKKS